MSLTPHIGTTPQYLMIGSPHSGIKLELTQMESEWDQNAMTMEKKPNLRSAQKSRPCTANCHWRGRGKGEVSSHLARGRYQPSTHENNVNIVFWGEWDERCP